MQKQKKKKPRAAKQCTLDHLIPSISCWNDRKSKSNIGNQLCNHKIFHVGLLKNITITCHVISTTYISCPIFIATIMSSKINAPVKSLKHKKKDLRCFLLFQLLDITIFKTFLEKAIFAHLRPTKCMLAL